MSTDQYSGITDAEQSVIQGFHSNNWAPQTIVGAYIFVPIIGGIIANVILSAIFPLIWQPAYVWVIIVFSWIIELLHWLSVFREANSKPWIELTYSISKTQWWRNEFMLLGWKIIGYINADSKIKTPEGELNVKKTWGKIVMELEFGNEFFRKMIMIAPVEFEKLCSFRGSSGVVIHKNFMFEVSDITHLGVVRPQQSFTADDIHPFIPIVVPTDCSYISEEICKKSELEIPNPQVEQMKTSGSKSYDLHYATYYAQQLKGVQAMKDIVDESRKNLRDSVSNEAGEVVKDVTLANETTTPGGRNYKIATKRNLVIIIIIVTVTFIGLAARFGW